MYTQNIPQNNWKEVNAIIHLLKVQKIDLGCTQQLHCLSKHTS